MQIYRTAGTCARQIIFEVKDDKLESCKFINGCSGNGQGVAKLSVGENIDTLIEKLAGIRCKHGTSCPDQLAKALAQYKEKQIELQEKANSKLSQS